jgi:hypothetical protein
VGAGTLPADPPSPKFQESEVTFDVLDVKLMVLHDDPAGANVKSSVYGWGAHVSGLQESATMAIVFEVDEQPLASVTTTE